jgi:hypothetical protein
MHGRCGFERLVRFWPKADIGWIEILQRSRLVPSEVCVVHLKASRLLLRTALELGTAGWAKVATVTGHARPDTANV